MLHAAIRILPPPPKNFHDYVFFSNGYGYGYVYGYGYGYGYGYERAYFTYDDLCSNQWPQFYPGWGQKWLREEINQREREREREGLFFLIRFILCELSKTWTQKLEVFRLQAS